MIKAKCTFKMKKKIIVYWLTFVTISFKRYKQNDY